MSDQATPALRMTLTLAMWLIAAQGIYLDCRGDSLSWWSLNWLALPIVTWILALILLPDYFWWPNHQAERVERIRIKFDDKEE